MRRSVSILGHDLDVPSFLRLKVESWFCNLQQSSVVKLVHDLERARSRFESEGHTVVFRVDVLKCVKMQNCLLSYRVSSFERIRAAEVFSSNCGTDRFQLADFDVLLVVDNFRRVIVDVFDEDCDLFSNCGIARSFARCILRDGSINIQIFGHLTSRG